MKASPNREQQIFLIVGGIIFGLIVVVVVYSMIQDPKQTMVEDVVRRPTVVAPANRPSEDAKRPWIETVRPAPIFENAQARTVVPPRPDQAGELPSGAANEEAGHPDQQQAAQGGQQAAQSGQKSPPVAAAVAPAAAKKGGKTPPAASKPGGNADAIGAWAANEQREQVMPEPEEGPQPKAKPGANAKQPPRPAQGEPSPAAKGVRTKGDPSPPRTAQQTQPTKAPAQPANEEPEEAAPAAAPAGGGYSVQLGSFNSSDRAKAVQEKVRKVQFEGRPMPLFQKVNVVSGQSHYRVRMGPFSSQKQAEQAAQLVMRQTGLEGKVLSPGK
ncbi:MAG: SPOR domain-containing protein [Magnetococcales bacterium]|nr:SPOR domain-containing protein [Magnetococcales bacterium]